MGCHLVKKHGRDKLQKKTYAENHEKILNILRKNQEGITRGNLKKQIKMPSGKTITLKRLRKHLRDFGQTIRIENHLVHWEPNYQRLRVIKELMDLFYSTLMKAGLNPESIFANYVHMFIPEKIDQGTLKLHYCSIPLDLMDADPKKRWEDARKALITTRSIPVKGI